MYQSKENCMKTRNTLLVVLTTISSFCSINLNAENILLRNLYVVIPMDNSKETWEDDGGSLLPPYITAEIADNILQVDFDQPAGNVEVVISQSNGMTVHRQNALNPQSMTIDMNGAETGRYLLEVYTDTEAVGGVFEVE